MVSPSTHHSRRHPELLHTTALCSCTIVPERLVLPSWGRQPLLAVGTSHLYPFSQAAYLPATSAHAQPPLLPSSKRPWRAAAPGATRGPRSPLPAADPRRRRLARNAGAPRPRATWVYAHMTVHPPTSPTGAPPNRRGAGSLFVRPLTRSLATKLATSPLPMSARPHGRAPATSSGATLLPARRRAPPVLPPATRPSALPPSRPLSSPAPLSSSTSPWRGHPPPPLPLRQSICMPLPSGFGGAVATPSLPRRLKSASA
jgi:hypothetical protein